MGADGKWEISMHTPMGAQAGTLNLKEAAMPIMLEFSAKVDGDEISGNVELGTFGDATFEGSRARRSSIPVTGGDRRLRACGAVT